MKYYSTQGKGQALFSARKSEYFVPSVVNAQLQEGSATITVLDTPDAWHGVTYPEDLPGVKTALKALTDAGTYPENFWK